MLKRLIANFTQKTNKCTKKEGQYSTDITFYQIISFYKKEHDMLTSINSTRFQKNCISQKLIAYYYFKNHNTITLCVLYHSIGWEKGFLTSRVVQTRKNIKVRLN